MTNLPVLHVETPTTAINPTLAPARAFCFASPCITIGFFNNDAIWKPSVDFSTKIVFDRQIALIDTGADGVYVDRRLIEKWQCPIAEGGEQMTVNNEPGSTAHRAALFVIEQGRVIKMWVMARDFVRENRPFQIVLGRRFLQFCDLRWNGPEQKVTLTIGQNPKAF